MLGGIIHFWGGNNFMLYSSTVITSFRGMFGRAEISINMCLVWGGAVYCLRLLWET